MRLDDRAADREPHPHSMFLRRKERFEYPLWMFYASAAITDFDLQSLSNMRRAVVRQAERKHALGKAPAYVYTWEWPTPAFNGKFGAIHGTDVGTAFHNTRGAMYGETPASHVMADRHAGAWVAFASTGDPNHAGIPHWDPYTPETRASLV